MAVKYVFNPFTGNLDSINTDGFNKTVEAICKNTDEVQDCVRIDSAKVGNLYEVEAVDIDVDNDPAVGIIIAKSSPTLCTVQLFGIVTGVYTALTPGRTYLVGTDSKLATTLARPASGFRWVQQMGVALDTDELLLKPSGFRSKLIGP